ncbi:hypothetical protein NP493_579g00015 [Ridgeia piscesae]|uniref:Metalloendopeptidase n=1 Tax=Ridgeia piscesae TaxID=27915 RepID=A0AAD9KUP1_RIDPI|nr:hypothetical protein NP493_579g00015 [Ridgeia piscesae]
MIRFSFRRQGSLWRPTGDDTREDWLGRHGLKKGIYEESLALVKRCKVMMLRNEGLTVTREAEEQMDIFLYGTLPTLGEAKECVELHKRRHKRKLINLKAWPTRKWPMPIIYKYDGAHTTEDVLMIEAAIKHWESETCIRFKRVATNATVTEQHILFTAGSTCSSFVGRVKKSNAFPQQINLMSEYCTQWLGFPVHEIGHAIGFWHEHVRPDRDDYVTVNMSYVYPRFRNNFLKLNKTLVDIDMSVPYDYGSVMHYAATELSIGRLHAIEPKNPLYLKTMGQRVGLSFFDAKLANLAYCKDKCAGVKPHVRCYRGGYRDPNNCRKCKCPEGFGRSQCRRPARANGGCRPTSSSIIYVRSRTEKCLWTRNYNQADGKGAYRHGDKCNWFLKARAGKKIVVRFAGRRFSTYCDYDSPSCFQWVEIKYKKDLALRGPRFCCNPGDIPKFNGKNTLTSESNKMMVIFNAEYPIFKINNYYTHDVPVHYMKGFKLCYKLA